MRFSSIALIAVLFLPTPSFAAPTEAEVAAARLAYIDGNYDSAL